MNRLVDARGNARFGIFAEPIEEVNHHDYDLRSPFGRRIGPFGRHFGFNQFQFLGALCDELVVACAIANVRYAGTAFVYVFEPRSGRFTKRSFRAPLALGVACDTYPESGTFSYDGRGVRIRMTGTARPRTRHLQCETDGLRIDARFEEHDPDIEPMCICTPAGATGWVYARKTAGQRATGIVETAHSRFDLAALGALGHLDWSAGYMRRHTFWNWGCLAGRLADGRSVGLNVSCGVNETCFTENCFWLDGRLHKVDSVYFDHDRHDVRRPWRLTSFDGRVELDFQPDPVAGYGENVNAGILASNFHQIVGRYRGTLRTASGEKLVLDNLLGYAERHYAKW